MEVEQKQRAGSSLWLGEAAGVFLATSTSQPPWHGGRERQRAWIEPHVCYLHSGRAGHEKYIYLCTWWDLSRPDSLVPAGCGGCSIPSGQTPLSGELQRILNLSRPDSLSGGLQKILALPVVRRETFVDVARTEATFQSGRLPSPQVAVDLLLARHCRLRRRPLLLRSSQPVLFTQCSAQGTGRYT